MSNALPCPAPLNKAPAARKEEEEKKVQHIHQIFIIIIVYLSEVAAPETLNV